MKKLTQAKNNAVLIFDSVEGGCGVKQRLTDMGLIPGERFKLLQNTGYGPVSIILKGVRVALGHGVAEKILVKEDVNNV